MTLAILLSKWCCNPCSALAAASDYLIRVQEGGFYGWPYAYIGKHPQPGFANQAPDKVQATALAP
jgi:glucose/arabinose dehydrogenase